MGAALDLNRTSTPSISEFDPKAVPFQWVVICEIENYDYSLGKHEILLSGSVGSAKSLLCAHIVVARHCLRFAGARACLARRSMPDLKDTIFKKCLEHIGEDLVEGKDYWVNETKASIRFANGSEIISRSWADRKSKKGRSLELSMLVIEESAENDDKDKLAIEELTMRVGRLPHIPQHLVIHATNPDSPAHWLYKYFISTNSPTRHVYYSLTRDNKFLPSWYIEQMQRDLDPKMAKRMLEGQWIEIAGEVIYYNYSERNKRDACYLIDPAHPIYMSFDFNIGDGKPMSAVLFQYIHGVFHFFEECVVHGARTESLMEEAIARELFRTRTLYIIQGDATGKARHPAAKHSNYEIIKQCLDQLKHIDERGREVPLEYELQVPSVNPPIRTRHNVMNARFGNVKGEVTAYVYADCKVLDEGLRLTKLKEGATYLEDDSKEYQHVTTAAGYGVCRVLKYEDSKPQGTVQL